MHKYEEESIKLYTHTNMATIPNNRIQVQDVYHLIELIQQGKMRFRIRGAFSHVCIDYADGEFDLWYSVDGYEERLSVPEMSNANTCDVAMALSKGALYTDE